MPEARLPADRAGLNNLLGSSRTMIVSSRVRKVILHACNGQLTCWVAELSFPRAEAAATVAAT